MGADKIAGKEGMGNVHEEAATVLASGMKKSYQSREFTLNNGQTDYNFATQQSAFGVSFPRAHAILIRSTQNITVKFNDAGNDAISIDADTPFPYSALEMTNVFFTNASGSNATVRVILG